MFGFLFLVQGPMFSGKTSRMMELYDEECGKGRRCLFIKHIDDNRYCHDMVVSHNMESKPCAQVSQLNEIFNLVKRGKFDNIMIDEAHFFDGTIYKVVSTLLSNGYNVYLASLNCDFELRPFNGLAKLAAMADCVEHLTAYKCGFCDNQRGIFTLRTCAEPEDVTNIKEWIGGSEKYQPACRTCYHQYKEFFAKNFAVRIQRVDKNASLPIYKTNGSAGADLAISESIILKPGERVKVRTGLKIGLPKNHAALIIARSGWMMRGIVVKPAILDSDFIGEVMLIVQNESDSDIFLESGNRIAQILSIGSHQMSFVEIPLLNSSRGEGGFGSTGF